jgi:hypothetical protein
MLWLRAGAAFLLALAVLVSEPSLPAALDMSFSASDRAPADRAQCGTSGWIDPNRRCQTVRECRFTGGGNFRGCLSAYSCRTCEFVPAHCAISGREHTCQRLRCHWGH